MKKGGGASVMRTLEGQWPPNLLLDLEATGEMPKNTIDRICV